MHTACIRVPWQQENAFAGVVRPDVRTINARIGENESQPMNHDQHAAPITENVVTFGEDELDETGILVGLSGQFNGPVGRRDRLERYNPTLRLGNDLLGNDDDVAVAQGVACPGDAFHDERRDIITGLHKGHARQSEETE